jgi:hypothetical protein
LVWWHFTDGVGIVAATANTYSGPSVPDHIAAMSFVVGLTFLPETKDREMAPICLVKTSTPTFPFKETDKWVACRLNIGSSL